MRPGGSLGSSVCSGGLAAWLPPPAAPWLSRPGRLRLLLRAKLEPDGSKVLPDIHAWLRCWPELPDILDYNSSIRRRPTTANRPGNLRFAAVFLEANVRQQLVHRCGTQSTAHASTQRGEILSQYAASVYTIMTSLVCDGCRVRPMHGLQRRAGVALMYAHTQKRINVAVLAA